MIPVIQKKIVITGGNSGIGFETTKGLFGDGHDIIFGCRDEKKNM
jgi:NAD(P)-dependent dehydrogenase (short-subunit alcohol dehydrogenase family)